MQLKIRLLRRRIAMFSCANFNEENDSIALQQDKESYLKRY